jgi:hypothetical protein
MFKSVLHKITAYMLVFLVAAALSEANAAPLAQQDQNTLPPSSEQAQPATPQNPSAGNQQPGDRPVGTAVAPAEKSSGVTASRPAGAVIAPAKQRRVRAIFIKIAVIAGAGAAIGAVAVLSHSSPSQPH